MIKPHLVNTNQVLATYIRTGLKPLVGGRAYVVDAEGRDIRDGNAEQPARACPIGAICIDKTGQPPGDAGDFAEVMEINDGSGEGNICWVDGFVHGWEETETNGGYSPQDFSYTAEENPEGLEVYIRGYQNGQRIRQDFIKLGLRRA